MVLRYESYYATMPIMITFTWKTICLIEDVLASNHCMVLRVGAIGIVGDLSPTQSNDSVRLQNELLD